MKQPTESKPAGYGALIADLGLDTLPPWHSSFVRQRGSQVASTSPAGTVVHYPPSYDPDQTPLAQLEFALKHDGINLEVLRAAFEILDPREIAVWVRSKPTGKYTRRGWFLYEWLTGRTLDVPDAASGSYVHVLEPAAYFVTEGIRSPRHRVQDNLLGTPAYCPIVRRSDGLLMAQEGRLDERVRSIVTDLAPGLLERAAQYLYLKETRSSFEIEREMPDRKRTLRFVELLRSTISLGELDEPTLVKLQKAILDPRYAQDGFRSDQNYVGQTLPGYRERVHYISPKPSDVSALMQGLHACSGRLAGSSIDPVVQAAVVGFGFVFIHPFGDGNGRLHRYLIHHVLSRAGFTPPGLVLPVSAAMLADAPSYDAALESFSRPLMERLRYDIDARGELAVHGESVSYYRYPDATRMAEYLYSTIERTIETDLVGELEFLRRFDLAWRRIRAVVDMPDRRLELFLRLCLSNGGRLSARKRSQFEELTDDELRELESIVIDSGLDES